jgi:hypothetical protein
MQYSATRHGIAQHEKKTLHKMLCPAEAGGRCCTTHCAPRLRSEPVHVGCHCWVLQHQHRLCRGSCQDCAYLATSPRCPGLLPSRQSWCLCRQCSQAHPGQAAHTCNTQPQQQQEQTCDSWPPPGGTICRIAARLQLRLNAKRQLMCRHACVGYSHYFTLSLAG